MEFDPVSYAMGQTAAGPSVEVEALSAAENKTYTAPGGKAYSPVTVNVPNTYTSGDEGKVVSEGALVSQTSKSVSANGTVDTTTNNSVTVAVPNPNSVTNITGTLADAWGSAYYPDVAAALLAGNATVHIAFDATAIGAGTGENYLVPLSGGGSNLNGAFISQQQQAAFMVVFNAAGELTSALVFDGSNVVDISEYASVITTQTVITWHPMT